jgi:predicted porin
MGTLKNNQVLLTKLPSAKSDFRGLEWSNSYLAYKGVFASAKQKFGFDYQLLINTEDGVGSTVGKLQKNLDTRDAYVYFSDDLLGYLSFGKMDTIYKDWGDRYPMLGISSSNFVSTSGILSRAAWKAEGDTSFHNRRNNTLSYKSPIIGGYQIGSSYSFNEGELGPGGPGTSLWAYALRWTDDFFYLSLAREIHYDWLTMSKGITDPSTSSIQNDSRYTGSRDHATRFSVGLNLGKTKLGFDVAQLKYAETSSISMPGKFVSYQNQTYQISADHKLNQNLTVAYNFVQGSVGKCGLSGGVACYTTNLGGYQHSVGILYNVDKNFSWFLLGAVTRNNPGSRYRSTTQGGDLYASAMGIKYQFD